MEKRGSSSAVQGFFGSLYRFKLYDADPCSSAHSPTPSSSSLSPSATSSSPRSSTPRQCQSWIKTNVQPYLPATTITSITLSNKVLTFDDSSLSDGLFSAMQSVHNALATLGLDKQVTITIAHFLGVQETFLDLDMNMKTPTSCISLR